MISAKTAKYLSKKKGNEIEARRLEVEASIKSAAIKGKMSCTLSPSVLREDLRQELKALGYELEHTDDYTYHWWIVKWYGSS